MALYASGELSQKMRYMEKRRSGKELQEEETQNNKNRSGDRQTVRGRQVGAFTKEVPLVYSCLALSSCSLVSVKWLMKQI